MKKTPIIHIWNNKPLSITYGFHTSSFGLCLIGITKDMICYLSFPMDKDQGLQDFVKTWPECSLKEDNKQTKALVDKIFGQPHNQPLNLLLKGTPFQIKVWQTLLQIPVGKTSTYSQVAKGVGSLKGARATGSAIGRNNIAYLIPCHRVIAQSGHLGGFKWGLGLKKALLKAEGHSLK